MLSSRRVVSDLALYNRASDWTWLGSPVDVATVQSDFILDSRRHSDLAALASRGAIDGNLSL